MMSELDYWIIWLHLQFKLYRKQHIFKIIIIAAHSSEQPWQSTPLASGFGFLHATSLEIKLYLKKQTEKFPCYATHSLITRNDCFIGLDACESKWACVCTSRDCRPDQMIWLPVPPNDLFTNIIICCCWIHFVGMHFYADRLRWSRNRCS